jgi:hypothetical protein
MPEPQAAFAALPADERMALVDQRVVLAEVLAATLTELQRAFVVQHYGLDGGDPASFSEIARRHGISSTRAGRCVARALQRLRRHSWRLSEVYTRSGAPVIRVRRLYARTHQHQVDVEAVRQDSGLFWAPCVHCGCRVNVPADALFRELDRAEAALKRKAARG